MKRNRYFRSKDTKYNIGYPVSITLGLGNIESW